MESVGDDDWLERRKLAKMFLTSSLEELGGMAHGVICAGEKCFTNISSSSMLE